MKLLRLACIPILLAAGVLLVLYAQDIRSWPPSVAHGDLRASAGSSGTLTWQPATVLPASWSESVLGLRQDRRLRLAIERFRQTYALPPGFDGGLAGVKARAAAESALGGVAQDNDPRRASQALDLLGLLLFGDASAGGGSAAATRAVANLEQAVRLESDDDAAKTNLELVLRLLRAGGSRGGSAAAGGPRSTGHHGAGSGTPGQGY